MGEERPKEYNCEKHVPCASLIDFERILESRAHNTLALKGWHTRVVGDPAGNRTPNRQLRRLMLYPVELPDPHYTVPAPPLWLRGDGCQ
jgi:hypothetical protein